jgi:hypothetical protein
MNWMQFDRDTGLVKCFLGNKEVLSIQNEFLNVETAEELMEFIKSHGGINLAISEILKNK